MTTRKRPAGQNSGQPKSVSGQAAKLPEIKGRFERLCIKPEYVKTILVRHREILKQDSEAIISGLRTVRNGKWPGEGQISVMDRLRSLSITFATSGKSSPQDVTPAGRNPFIHEYCRILGVPSDAIDQLFQRFMTGDVTDKRAVVSESERAIAQLDTAIQIAHQQWMNGSPVIHRSNESAANEPAISKDVSQALADLNKTERSVLAAMLEQSAIPIGLHVAAIRIARRVKGPETKRNYLDRPIRELRNKNLIETARGVGCRLTDLGHKVANLIPRSE